MAAVKEMNQKARLVGINHVALEVGSIEEICACHCTYPGEKKAVGGGSALRTGAPSSVPATAGEDQPYG